MNPVCMASRASSHGASGAAAHRSRSISTHSQNRSVTIPLRGYFANTNKRVATEQPHDEIRVERPPNEHSAAFCAWVHFATSYKKIAPTELTLQYDSYNTTRRHSTIGMPFDPERWMAHVFQVRFR
jgi:hypothetical protein